MLGNLLMTFIPKVLIFLECYEIECHTQDGTANIDNFCRKIKGHYKKTGKKFTVKIEKNKLPEYVYYI